MQTNVEQQFTNPVQMQPVQVQMQPVNQFMQPMTIPVRNEPKGVKAYKGLAITQLVIGVLNLVLGIAILAAFDYRGFSIVGTGTWNGIIFLIAGIIGVVAVRDLQNNSCLNGTYMAFSIIATNGAGGGIIISILAALFWCDSLYGGCASGSPKPIYWVLLILNVAEVGVSIAAAVFCCRNTACCNNTTQGFIITPSAQYQYQPFADHSETTTANIPQSQATDVPVKGVTPYPQQFAAVSYPCQLISQAPNGMIITSQPQLMAGQAGQANVVYSAEHTQQVPPPYSPVG